MKSTLKTKTQTHTDHGDHGVGPIHAHSLAQTQLRDAAVRITSARVKVLAVLLAARRAFSHQELQDTFVDMDRVTLYRALDCLTDAGLAHKIPGDDRVFRYSAGTEHAELRDPQNPGQHQHGHFKCTRCAKVFCLDGTGNSGIVAGMLPEAINRSDTLRQQLQTTLQLTLGKGFQSHDIELTIKGWCADCAH